MPLTLPDTEQFSMVPQLDPTTPPILPPYIPTLAAIEKKKRIALANKETLVCAGELVVAAADRCGAEIRARRQRAQRNFQCLQGCRDRGEIKRLILTCSGGPFYGLSLQELATKTKADALKHPNWTMGCEDHHRLRDADEQGP